MSNEKDSINMYLRQIGSIPLLSDPEERELGRIIKDNEPHTEHHESAVDELTTRNLRLVIPVAKRYSKIGVPLMDVIAYGNIGLIKAAHKFDIDKGCKFSTHAYEWIRQGISHHIPTEFSVRLPVHAREKMYRLNQLVDDFFSVYGRIPTQEELSEKTSIPKEYYNVLRKFYLSRPLSLDKKRINFSDSLSNETCLLDVLADEKHDKPHENLERNDLLSRMHKIIDSLPPHKKDIIQRRFGLNGYECQTLDSIGEVYGLTRERIRQIEAICFKKLRLKREVRELYTAYSG
jgi:RNA polymerase primary sigma factor